MLQRVNLAAKNTVDGSRSDSGATASAGAGASVVSYEARLDVKNPDGKNPDGKIPVGKLKNSGAMNSDARMT